MFDAAQATSGTLRIMNEGDTNVPALKKETSWAIARRIATSNHDWSFQLLNYRLLTIEEAEAVGGGLEDLCSYMELRGVAESLAVDAATCIGIGRIVAARQEAQAAERAGEAAKNEALASMSMVAAAARRRRQHAKRQPRRKEFYQDI